MAIIAIDFDGTIVTHEYPRVGKPLPLANEVINALWVNGNELFLYTMRDGDELKDAERYCFENNLPIHLFNESPSQFSSSPKQYAQVYIDDASLGCPLRFDPKFSNRPYVNWVEVAKYLAAKGLITQEQLNELMAIRMK